MSCSRKERLAARNAKKNEGKKAESGKAPAAGAEKVGRSQELQNAK